MIFFDIFSQKQNKVTAVRTREEEEGKKEGKERRKEGRGTDGTGQERNW